MKKQMYKWMVSLTLLLLVGCGQKGQDATLVSVTIEPQRYFAERIAGDKFTINCVVPAGQSPETYDPTPQQMIQIGKSCAYLRIGHIGFEQAWMENIAKNNPHLRIFDLSQGLNLIETQGEACTVSHGEGENAHHHHGGVDPHTWSSIQGAAVIAKNTLDAFTALDKENQDYYRANYTALMAEIEATGLSVAALLEPLRGKAFIIYHPALTYLAQEFGLTQLCIELEGKEPSPAQLKQLMEAASTHKAEVVFVQMEFDQKNAELIARETGCRLVRINPLDYNWSSELIRIAQALADEKAH